MKCTATDRYNLSRLVFRVFPGGQFSHLVTKVGVNLYSCIQSCCIGSYACQCCRTGSTLGLRALVQVACSSLHWPDPDGIGLSALQYRDPSLARSDE